MNAARVASELAEVERLAQALASFCDTRDLPRVLLSRVEEFHASVERERDDLAAKLERVREQEARVPYCVQTMVPVSFCRCGERCDDAWAAQRRAERFEKYGA